MDENKIKIHKQLLAGRLTKYFANMNELLTDYQDQFVRDGMSEEEAAATVKEVYAICQNTINQM